VFVQDRTGPQLAELRPLKDASTGRFPVHPDLVERLLGADTHPDETVAHALGVCAAYAYADTDTVAMMMARMGLPGSHVRRVGLYVDPMFISSTAYLVQSADGRVVVLAYRGTEPTRFINWLTDADIHPDQIAIPFEDEDTTYAVHGGFYRNVRATRFQIVSALQRALEGRSVHEDRDEVLRPLEALYVTGHSLGGAMAALLGVMLAKQSAYAPIAEVLRGVYTFGQPMVGTPRFAAACQDDPFLRERVVRFVYGRDVVAFLPPRDTGAFRHFGQERRFRRAWPWQVSAEPAGQMGFAAELVGVPLSFVARQFPLSRRLPFRYRIDDHLPHHYVAALTPPGVPNEFGDDPVTSVSPVVEEDAARAPGGD
jgi:hypothetical protein